MSLVCGIDFGTSNSTLGIAQQGRPALLALEREHLSIPSALFFNFEDHQIRYGREAIDHYIEGDEGRLMRSLKSILGTSLMRQDTFIGQRRLSYSDIIADFIREIRKRAEAKAGAELTQLVAGRPVHFIDDDKNADNAAQESLANIYRQVGFKEIEFQFEPIAAAIHYEQQLQQEELALIVDIGGGTSDFTIIRLSPDRMLKTERFDDILATTGVHIGGNDFDRRFNIFKAMPLLGMNSYLSGTPRLEMPRTPYFDLATWHLIHKQYSRTHIHNIQQLKLRAEHPELIDRLLKVLKRQDGHRLIAHVETCKIDLSERVIAQLDLSFIEDELHIDCQRSEFDEATSREVTNIGETITETLQLAQTRPEQINSIFLTGGTTGLPSIHHVVRSIFPNGKLVEGDRYGSVGLGLTLDAMRRFG